MYQFNTNNIIRRYLMMKSQQMVTYPKMGKSSILRLLVLMFVIPFNEDCFFFILNGVKCPVQHMVFDLDAENQKKSQITKSVGSQTLSSPLAMVQSRIKCNCSQTKKIKWFHAYHDLIYTGVLFWLDCRTFISNSAKHWPP